MSERVWIGVIAALVACLFAQIILTYGHYPYRHYTGLALLGVLGLFIVIALFDSKAKTLRKPTTQTSGPQIPQEMGVNLNVSFSWRWLFTLAAICLVVYLVLDKGLPSHVETEPTAGIEAAAEPDNLGVISRDHGEEVWAIEVDGLGVKLMRTERPSCASGFMDRIEISGGIGPDSTFVVEEMLERVKGCSGKGGKGSGIPVYLNSLGGMLDHGYLLGYMFRDWEVYTRIREGDGCASACAVAFLGGVARRLSDGGGIMFHAPYVKDGDSESITCDLGKQTALELLAYYIEMMGEEAGARIFERTMMYCSNSDGWVIAQGEAADLYGINSTGGK